VQLANLVAEQQLPLVSSLSRSSSSPSARALPSVVISAVAVTNSVRTPRRRVYRFDEDTRHEYKVMMAVYIAQPANYAAEVFAHRSLYDLNEEI
jgi:hypothetical protein